MMKCLIIMAAVLLNSVNTDASESKPLLLLIAGGMGAEVGRSSMQRLYDEDIKRNCSEDKLVTKVLSNRPFFLDELADDHEAFNKRAMDNIGNHKDIVVAGHSLGGHTGYRIARHLTELKEKKKLANDTSVLLVTLDPTSILPLWRSSIAPTEWQNIYIKRISIYSMIRWGFERKAFRNHRFYWGSFTDHFRVPQMFLNVREVVMEHLGYPCSHRYFRR